MTAGRKYSLRFTIASLVVVLLLATVAGVLLIAFLIRARTIAATAHSLQSEVSTRITERVVERFTPIPGMLLGLEASVTRGGALPPEGELLERLVDRMRYETRIEWLAWVAADGSGVGALTHPEGVLAVRLQPGGMAQAEVRHADGSRTAAPALDLRSIQDAPWIKTAHATEGTVWSEIYKRPLDGQLGRACVLAVRREEQVLGVLGVGFSVSFMRSYLNSLRVGETGAVFALGPDGAIRTSPSDAALARLGPAVEAAVRRLEGGMAGLDPGVLHSIGVEVEGVDYHVGISRQTPEGVPSWVHALVVPDDELIGYFGGYLLAGLLAVGLLLLLAVAAAKLLARRVAQSLDSIASDLQRVGSFELGERPRLESRIREIAVVADASERMKASLRSFGRYVPTDLVRDLLAQGQEARIGGAQRPLTLFFSDVAGFTGSSEGMEPEVLVAALGEYLEVLTRAVEVHAGTIDKFIGDGVLAFFNAPRADAQHVSHACEAALGVQAALAEAAPGWHARGLPDFSTRIGLHTADVVVGNIGTPERFAYTVIGDGVNLAARLESLNKAYGTSILASQDVRDATGETFAWRAIDRTAVVGRKAGGTVHELLGRSGEVADARLEQARAYEAAFALYLARRFDEAADAFTRLGAGDAPARILAARAAAYAQQPPPEDWTGVYVQTKK